MRTSSPLSKTSDDRRITVNVCGAVVSRSARDLTKKATAGRYTSVSMVYFPPWSSTGGFVAFCGSESIFPVELVYFRANRHFRGVAGVQG